MYALAERLDPESYLALARATYAEMALAGITTVGEFHYLHHGPDGDAVRRPERDGPRADRRGRRGRHADHADRRLLPARRDRRRRRRERSSASRTAARRRGPSASSALDETESARIGRRDPQRARGRPRRRRRPWRAGPRERGPPAARARVRAARRERGVPGRLREHAHRRCSPRPARWPRTSPRCTRRISTTTTWGCSAARRVLLRVPDDRARPGRRHRPRCAGSADAGASLSLGSDSHAVIDLFEEARAVELDERLASGERGRHGAAELLRAASADGHACLGWPDAGRIEPGARADLVTVALDGVRLAGWDPRARARRRGVRGRRRGCAARAGGRQGGRPRRPAHEHRRGRASSTRRS